MSMNKFVCAAVTSIIAGCGGGGGSSSSSPAVAVTVVSAPVVQLNTTHIDFGFELPNRTGSPKEVIIKNGGNSALSINEISFNGGDTTTFAQTNNCGSTLSAGASCSMKITFAPNGVGGKFSTVRIATNAKDSPHTVTLSGSGADYGDIADTAVEDACDLKQKRKDVKNGVYWFRGLSGKPVQTHANFTTGIYDQNAVEIDLPACWTQFRRIPATGGWYPFDDNLSGLGDDHNVSFASETNSTVAWNINLKQLFDWNFRDPSRGRFLIMFMTGNGAARCTLVMNPNKDKNLVWGSTGLVVDSSGVGVKRNTAAHGDHRFYSKTTIFFSQNNLDTPLIGCEGNNVANQMKMLYAEAGSSMFTEFKNSQGGINIFIMKIPGSDWDTQNFGS